MSDRVATTLDVRPIIPMARHAQILRAFDTLSPGEALVIINDHRPQMLYAFFRLRRPDQFAWSYLDEGPDVWRVEIRKTHPATSRAGV